MAQNILEEKGLDMPPNIDLSGLLDFSIIPDDEYRKCPLNEGDELIFGFDGILDEDEEMQFTFEIVSTRRALLSVNRSSHCLFRRLITSTI